MQSSYEQLRKCNAQSIDPGSISGRSIITTNVPTGLDAQKRLMSYWAELRSGVMRPL